ncbi:MAG: hypothetical protein IMF09_04470 [Proteobacteria bacterium]|nr:hypothetical protein [Pseudomonadota bacterium]
MRNGITYKTTAEWLRWTYAMVARDEFKLPGRKQSKSRIAVLTGLSRVEVDRLLNAPDPHTSPAIDQYHRASRVLDGWVHDSTYKNGDSPLDLSFEGTEPSFSSLVDSYAGGVPPRSILDELQRVNSIEKTTEGKIHLKQAYFVARNDKDTLYQFGILGFATQSLLETIDHNIYQEGKSTRLQLIASNNIPVEMLEDIKEKLQEYGRKCVVDADSFMFDKTNNTPASGELKQAGLSVYYFENPPEEQID